MGGAGASCGLMLGFGSDVGVLELAALFVSSQVLHQKVRLGNSAFPGETLSPILIVIPCEWQPSARFPTRTHSTQTLN